MATFLADLELGGGLGHLMALAPVARGLGQRGHRGSRLATCRRPIRCSAGWTLSASRLRSRRARTACKSIRPRTFPHILWNNGFADLDELQAMTSAWQAIYDYVRPDLILFDHSPTVPWRPEGFRPRSPDRRRVLVPAGRFPDARSSPLAPRRTLSVAR